MREVRVVFNFRVAERILRMEEAGTVRKVTRDMK